MRGPAGSQPPQKVGQRPQGRPCLAAFSPPPLESDVSPAKPKRPGEVPDSSRVTQVPRAEPTSDPQICLHLHLTSKSDVAKWQPVV